MVALSAEVDPFQVRPGTRLWRVRLVQALEPAEVDHDVEDGLLLVEAAFLGQVPEPGPVLRGEGLAADVQGPGGRLVDAQQRPEGRGLPGAVAAEEPEGFPGPDIEGEVFDDRGVPEVHPEVFDVYPCFIHPASRFADLPGVVLRLRLSSRDMPVPAVRRFQAGLPGSCGYRPGVRAASFIAPVRRIRGLP